jgi:imidazoleglycerol phosphate dehydratase HisB
MTVTINGTSGIVGLNNGSSSSPALAGDDSDTGIYFPTVNVIAFATAGTEKLRLEANGALKFSDNSIQTSAGISTGKAIAMAMIFGG